ncbi:peptidase S1 [Maricaulis sp.]|uniref:peptidase S1 n=1 Tax=Maricaulis sp. TaxID=1486257 RepID=UPI00262A1ABD|nr:peptidase S1 [Maricaulis sp.]
MTIKTILAATVAAAAFAGVSAAQDWSQNPTFGQTTLSAGFAPDPYSVSITAGGDIDASSALGGACRGMIANAPDYRLHYNAGSLPLYIGARSNADTTIVVNAPDGSWYCNDDTNGLNPQVSWGTPQSGQYDIWVGTYGSGSGLAQSTLTISELGH